MVGLQISGCCLNQPPLFGELDFHRFDDRARNLILDGKQISHVAIVLVRPYLITIRHAHQLNGNADAIARRADASFKYSGNAELTPDVADIAVAALVSK